jgi:uncharacterized membrane protein YbhN (UPF0104 family)
MEDTYRKETRMARTLKLLLKIIVTAVCLWYVSGKIDFKKAGEALSHAHAAYLVAGLLLYIASKIVSAYRLNLYFRNIGIDIPARRNLELYWLGMFYNLFLPGSISGDAYKVVLLTRRYGVPYKKTMAAVLLDRFSGLLGLGLLLAVYATIVLKENGWIAAVVAGSLLAVGALFLVIKYWLKDFLPSFIPTLLLGIGVQALQVICVYMLLRALGLYNNDPEYIFLFLVSSIVAVLPLTIGGLGAREIVFLEGSKYFGLIQEHSVIISILFYLITLVTSSWGLVYVFRDPLDKKKTSHPEADD